VERTHSADASTITGGARSDGSAWGRTIGLRILFHPDPARVDDFAPLFELGEPATCSVQRQAPLFRDRVGQKSSSLASAHVSRNAFRLTHLGDETLLEPAEAIVYCGPARLERERRFSRAELIRGVALGVGEHVVLWLGPASLGADADEQELVGSSDAMRQVRREIGQVADLDTSVLLRGESGVGKELVAAALHRRSRRAAGPFVAINMAAVPASTAVAELFGHARGAFTGASGKRAGYFEQANGGSLFLDEIGQTPNDVQPMLLRAIEAGEVQVLGGARQRVDVRVIAATDSNLEQAIALGRFHFPLLRRFEYSIVVPPLRERKDDLGRLFLHFLRRELGAVGESGRLAAPDPDRQPWLPAGLGLALARYDFPGNVRELKNLVKRYVIHNRGRDELKVDSQIESDLGLDVAPAPADASEARPQRPPSQLGDDEIAAAWQKSGFRREQAAELLGVGTTWLTKRLERCQGVRLAKDISAAELEAAYRGAGGDVERAAGKLEVSTRALVLQIRRLKLEL
jgi:two-component system, NtrC family, nitrogen regulation response regulator GlnG